MAKFLLIIILLSACSENNSPDIDTDGDGYSDKIDAFPLNPNEYLDSDSDGLTDRHDAFPNNPSETVDTDGDGVGNNQDNCFLWPNPNQRDSNKDGVGDICSYNDTGATYRVAQIDDISEEWKTELDCNSSLTTTSDDCSYGRDAKSEVELDKLGSGLAAFDYTKISLTGEELHPDATEDEGWACTRDNVTGLMWELKSNQMQPDENDAFKQRRYIHSKGHLYIYYDPNLAITEINSNMAPEPNPNYTSYIACEALPYGTEEVYGSEAKCTSSNYIARILEEYKDEGGLCGLNDWRMPTIHELNSLASYNHPVNGEEMERMLIDTQFFNIEKSTPGATTSFMSSSLALNERVMSDSDFPAAAEYFLPLCRNFVDHRDGRHYINTQLLYASEIRNFGRRVMLVSKVNEND